MTANDLSNVSILDYLEDFLDTRFNLPSSRAKKLLLNQLMIDGNDRHMVCLKSIDRTRNYLEWIYTEGSLKHINGSTKAKEFIKADNHTVESKKQADYHLDIDQKLRLAVKEQRLNKKNEIKYYSNYFISVYNHLLVQKEIISREVDLASSFSASANSMIQMNISNLNHKKPEAFIMAAKIMKTAVERDLSKIELAAISFSSVMDQLNKFNDFIESRKSQLDSIKKIVGLLHKIVHKLVADRAQSAAASKATPTDPKSNGQRMHYGKKRKK